MHMINLVASAFPHGWISGLTSHATEHGVCCVTGEYCETIPRKSVITSSFGDTDRLIAPYSNRISLDAYIAFKGGYFGANEDGSPKKIRKKPESMSCWWCDGNRFEELDKAGIRKKLFVGSQGACWGGYVTTSYKKHGSLRAPINIEAFGAWAFNDNLAYMVCPEENRWIWSILREAQAKGVSRNFLAGEDMTMKCVEGQELSYIIRLESFIKGWMYSHRYQLLCYLLPSKQEIEEGFIDYANLSN